MLLEQPVSATTC